MEIFNEEYETIIPQPRQKAVTVMNFVDAKKAFQHFPIDFVIALDESKGTFGKCFSVAETEEFYRVPVVVEMEVPIGWAFMLTDSLTNPQSKEDEEFSESQLWNLWYVWTHSLNDYPPDEKYKVKWIDHNVDYETFKKAYKNWRNGDI